MRHTYLFQIDSLQGQLGNRSALQHPANTGINLIMYFFCR
jgi:hypothetical protein